MMYREVNVRGGPMKGGFSTSESSNDAFVKTSPLKPKIRAKLKEEFNILTNSVHKELTIGSRKKHDRIVSRLATVIEENVDPFLDDPARHIITGTKKDQQVIVS